MSDSDNLTIKDADIFPKQLDWFSAVGMFILNFGNLEWLMLCFLEKQLSDEEFQRCKNLHFKDRMERVEVELRALGEPGNQSITISEMMASLDELRILRNHIAHGNLNISMEQGNEGYVSLALPRDLDKPFDGDCRQLKLSELKVAVNRLNRANEAFKQLSRFGKPT